MLALCDLGLVLPRDEIYEVSKPRSDVAAKFGSGASECTHISQLGEVREQVAGICSGKGLVHVAFEVLSPIRDLRGCWC